MRAYLQLGCVALALLLPLGALQLDLSRKQLDRQPFPDRAPDAVGPWRAVESRELPPEAFEMLAPEAYSMRYYEAETRPPIWIYAAFYRGVGSISPHYPALCYPAQGWTVTEDREERISPDASESFPARFMRAELSDTDELVLYWRQPAGRWPRRMPLESLMRLNDKAFGLSDYAFVRISLRRPRSPGGISAGDMDALQAMAVAIAPWVRNAVTPRPAL